MSTLTSQLAEEVARVRATPVFENTVKWMRADDTMSLVRDWLTHIGLDASESRVRMVLAFVYMQLDDESLFSTSAADTIMRREVQRVVRAFDALLADDDVVEHRLRFCDACARAERFFETWSTHDRRAMIEQLVALVAACKTSVDDPPNAELLEQLQRLGGDAAVARARAQYAAHVPMSREEIAETVTRTARRAFWDVLRADLVAERYDGLFGVLDEMGRGMRALIAHSERGVAELDDTFDVSWLRQQVEAECLEPDDVRRLMLHLARTIADWQAPIDAAEARTWVADVERRANAEASLACLVRTILVDFLAEAHERLGNLCARILALRPDELAAQD